jgi:hypothetical protein
VSPEAPDAPEPEKRVTLATDRFFASRGVSYGARSSRIGSCPSAGAFTWHAFVFIVVVPRTRHCTACADFIRSVEDSHDVASRDKQPSGARARPCRTVELGLGGPAKTSRSLPRAPLRTPRTTDTRRTHTGAPRAAPPRKASRSSPPSADEGPARSILAITMTGIRRLRTRRARPRAQAREAALRAGGPATRSRSPGAPPVSPAGQPARRSLSQSDPQARGARLWPTPRARLARGGCRRHGPTRALSAPAGEGVLHVDAARPKDSSRGGPTS